MRTIKKVASHIFIDGFGGMTQGLFATLIIGTMIQQIGLLIGGSTGNVIYLLGKAAAALTSAGDGYKRQRICCLQSYRSAPA